MIGCMCLLLGVIRIVLGFDIFFCCCLCLATECSDWTGAQGCGTRQVSTLTCTCRSSASTWSATSLSGKGSRSLERFVLCFCSLHSVFFLSYLIWSNIICSCVHFYITFSIGAVRLVHSSLPLRGAHIASYSRTYTGGLTRRNTILHYAKNGCADGPNGMLAY